MERRVVARRLVFGALMAVGTFAATMPWRATGEIIEADACAALPSGHPAIAGCADETKPAAPQLPPGHPPVDGALPPGHPPVRGTPALPPGHPPVDAGRDGTIVQPPLLRSSRPDVTPVVNL